MRTKGTSPPLNDDGLWNAIVWSPGGIAMDRHEGTGILPKAACSRHPALAPSQFQRARLPESSLKIVFAAFVIPRDERAMPAKF